MAEVTTRARFTIDVDWQSAEDGVARELSATWCSLQIWIGDECVTRVDAEDSGVRRAVNTSAYPLAEWIAYNWWALGQETSPSATPSSSWTWSRLPVSPWLVRHNLRAAGAGMPWPDLTLVPEGATTALSWTRGPGVANQPVRFIETGFAHVDSEEVQRALRRFVQQVIDRLDEIQLSTLLHKEWVATLALDEDEASFARAAAKLGLDPFSVPASIAADLIAVSKDLDPALLDEFLDSADPTNLPAAVYWLRRARTSIAGLQHRSQPISDLRNALSTAHAMLPYQRGYELARAVREQAPSKASDRFKVEAFVGQTSINDPTAGLRGFVGIDKTDHVGLVVPSQLSSNAQRFSQARALGLALSGSRTEYLLDPSHTDLMKLSRAFAAELLAPAKGIVALLAPLRGASDDAFEAVANQLDVSPLLVKLQYENQITGRVST